MVINPKHSSKNALSHPHGNTSILSPSLVLVVCADFSQNKIKIKKKKQKQKQKQKHKTIQAKKREREKKKTI